MKGHDMARDRVRRTAMLGAVIMGMAALIVGAGATAYSTGSGHGMAVAGERLPDLDQETPTELGVREVVSEGRRSYRLGFHSAIRNIGDGPLIIDARRSVTEASAAMTADQLIDAEAG